jgi:hypothetical protein
MQCVDASQVALRSPQRRYGHNSPIFGSFPQAPGNEGDVCKHASP